MSPESATPQLNLVTFQHLETDCPVRQTTPDAARVLSHTLTEARASVGTIAGAFLYPDHRGAALVVGDPDSILQTFKEVLATPPHEVKINAVDQADPSLAAILTDPKILEGDGAEAVANRTLLFEIAHQLDAEAGFDQSLEDETPSLSLYELEDYLAGKADDIARSAS